MNILISGASGLIGQALTKFFLQFGHKIYSLVRNSTNNPSGDSFHWQPDSGQISFDPEIVLDVVINLCGETSKGRWTPSKKASIVNSRVNSTRLISEYLCQLKHKPSLLISASAVGFYGDTGSDAVDESAGNGDDFLAEVSAKWEAASFPARNAGIRTVNMRTGVVLSKNGGALKEMLTPFKLGLGGVIGHGGQYWSWVSMTELLNMIQFIINTESIKGPVNLVSIPPATNREFTKTLGKVLRRPTLFPMPAFMARLLFGEMADAMLLSSVRVLPKKLQQAGYSFLYQDLESALVELLQD